MTTPTRPGGSQVNHHQSCQFKREPTVSPGCPPRMFPSVQVPRLQRRGFRRLEHATATDENSRLGISPDGRGRVSAFVAQPLSGRSGDSAYSI